MLAALAQAARNRSSPAVGVAQDEEVRMDAINARFPVIWRERACPESLCLLDEESAGILFEEFADIIVEFDAWDADCRRIVFGARPIDWPPKAEATSDRKGVLAALEQWCGAESVPYSTLEGESPVEAFQRLARGK